MRTQFLSIVTFSILTFSNPSTTFAMGSKDNPANHEKEVKTAEISGNQAELATKFIQTSKMLEFPALSKLVAPLEGEFKALGMPEKPFDKTFVKLNEYAQQFIQPVLNIIKKPMIDQAAKYFTADELKELIQIYEKPVMHKQYDFMLTWILGPAMSALQDPAVLAQYTQEIMGFVMSMAMQGSPQELTRKATDLSKLALEELSALEKSVKFDSPEFKTKLKERYKSVAQFIDMIDFGQFQAMLQNLSQNMGTILSPEADAVLPKNEAPVSSESLAEPVPSES